MEFSQVVAAVVVIPPQMVLELVDQVVVEMVDLLVELDHQVTHLPVVVAVVVEPTKKLVLVVQELSWFVIKLTLVKQELQKQLAVLSVMLAVKQFMSLNLLESLRRVRD